MPFKGWQDFEMFRQNLPNTHQYKTLQMYTALQEIWLAAVFDKALHPFTCDSTGEDMSLRI